VLTSRAASQAIARHSKRASSFHGVNSFRFRISLPENPHESRGSPRRTAPWSLNNGNCLVSG